MVAELSHKHNNEIKLALVYDGEMLQLQVRRKSEERDTFTLSYMLASIALLLSKIIWVFILNC